ncbi:MAG: UBA/THIF-type binding protein [Gemmataceae bacterium]|nr:UBA/THIF-type binding protein [Gemmataceae bacterium]
MVHLFQVGAGSGGIVVLDLLARDPRVTKVTLVDPDVYKQHNVHRHVFPPAAVGRPKVDLAAAWVRERRPDLAVETIAADITDPAWLPVFTRSAAACHVGVCAVDNEPAKFAFDALMRQAGKPWTLGEVLSGGIGGWVHRFTPAGPCYGCVASHLQRNVAEGPAAPPPDYADPAGPVPETTIPASKASIEVIAGLHAMVTLDLLAGVGREPSAYANGESAGPQAPGGLMPPARPDPEFTSLLFTLMCVPGVFDAAYRPYRFRIPKSAACLICSAVPVSAAGEDLDVALDQALARLGNE